MKAWVIKNSERQFLTLTEDDEWVWDILSVARLFNTKKKAEEYCERGETVAKVNIEEVK